MKNPWEEIPLTDYENHMKLASVMQLQAMNEMMKGQFAAYPVSSVMIFGIAGGNALNIFRKTNLKEYMGLTSMRHIYRQSFRGIRNWRAFWNVCVSI